ncbi:TRAP transporter substrate-binding protein [Nocardia carnea]|uniref:TRAP transporter substrate-binding protein n=1 Tax=Nocardia carnea TaxID=37328 RepID=UPI0024561CEE|nr:TRAP transporter substrate-binding protein DctP [Nocardia carnea]
MRIAIHRGPRAIFAAIVAVSVAACGADTEPTDGAGISTVSFVHDIPDGHPRLPYFDKFATEVGARSSDELDVVINPQEQVLAGRASLDAVLNGEANIAAVNMAHLEAIEPTAGFMNLPFGLDDTAMSDETTRDAVVATLAEQVRPHGAEVIGVMRGADQLLAFPGEDVRRLEDIRGKRIRVAGGGLYEALMRGLDAEPVPIPIPRLAQEMAAGTVDGVFTSPGGWSTEILTHAPHAVQVPGLMFITYGLVANADWLAGLSGQERDAVTSAGAEMTGSWVQMRDDDRNVVERVVSGYAGTYFVVPDVEALRWRQRVSGISERFLNQYPELGIQLRQDGLFVR